MALSPQERAVRAKGIKLVLMDVDGVWTEGGLFYVPRGDDTAQGNMVEAKTFDTQDGMGLRWAHATGIKTGLISGRESPGVTHRATMLGVTYIYQDFLEKIPPYEEILAKAGVRDEEVAYLGDDLPDAPLIRRVGLGVAVANARPELKRAADYVTTAYGGRGAIREVIEMLMRAQGTWDAVLQRYGLPVD
jgi:3-deoxy-D-manno-octulosonate 8-phosphate phosphatase (KDO 8-P phosphatase)